MKRRNMAAVSFVVAFAMFFLTSCETFDNFKAAFFGDKQEQDDIIRIGVFEPLSGEKCP